MRGTIHQVPVVHAVSARQIEVDQRLSVSALRGAHLLGQDKQSGEPFLVHPAVQQGVHMLQRQLPVLPGQFAQHGHAYAEQLVVVRRAEHPQLLGADLGLGQLPQLGS